MMNLLKNKNTLIILIIVVVILIFPLIVNFTLMSWKSSFMQGVSGDWLDFIGTYYGSIISGIISGALTLIGVMLTIKASFAGIEKTTKHDAKERYKDNIGKKLNYLYKVKNTVYTLERMLSARSHGWNEKRQKDEPEIIDNAIRKYIFPKFNELLEQSASVDWDFHNEIKNFVESSRKLLFSFKSAGLDKLYTNTGKLCKVIEKSHEKRLVERFKEVSSK